LKSLNKGQMKKIITGVALLLLTTVFRTAQNRNNLISLNLSTNKLVVGYQRSFEKVPVWGEVFIGVSNQDINSSFDDGILGLKAGIPLFQFSKSNIYGYVNTGIYFTNNDHYNATCPFAGVGTGYKAEFGKNRRHAFIAEIGYVYGRKSYTQTYISDILSASTTDVFKLSPLTISIGYGFKF